MTRKLNWERKVLATAKFQELAAAIGDQDGVPRGSMKDSKRDSKKGQESKKDEEKKEEEISQSIDSLNGGKQDVTKLKINAIWSRSIA